MKQKDVPKELREAYDYHKKGFIKKADWEVLSQLFEQEAPVWKITQTTLVKKAKQAEERKKQKERPSLGAAAFRKRKGKKIRMTGLPGMKGITRQQIPPKELHEAWFLFGKGYLPKFKWVALQNAYKTFSRSIMDPKEMKKLIEEKIKEAKGKYKEEMAKKGEAIIKKDWLEAIREFRMRKE